MLLFAKSGQQSTLADVDADDLVNHIKQSVEAYAAQRRVAIRWQDDDEGTALRINQTAVAGAIQNLITNAIDASQQGQSVVVETESSEGFWSCSVRDTGVGIDEAMKQRLFTPFATNKTHGTGLGLAVVDMVTKAHNGRIEWQSEKAVEANSG